MTAPKRQKIAILGYTSHRALAPWDNPEWEIWALNDLYLDMPQFSNEAFDLTRIRWFQLHTWASVRDWSNEPVPGDRLNPSYGPLHKRDPHHLLWLNEASQRFPVYLQREQEELPDCLAFGYDEMFTYFGKYYTANEQFKYFTNSITMMMAYAIMQLCPDPDDKPSKDAQIAVYGVDMQVAGAEGNSEYGYQRPSCEWAVGYCMGRGIPITIPDESDLCKTAFVYGDEHEHYFRKKIAVHKANQEQTRIQAANTRQAAMQAEWIAMGAKQTLEWLERGHMPGDEGIIGQAPVAHGHQIPMG